MKLTDDRNGWDNYKKDTFCAIKGDTCYFFNRHTVANIRRTEHAVMDCPQWLRGVFKAYACTFSLEKYGTLVDKLKKIIVQIFSLADNCKLWFLVHFLSYFLLPL